MKPNLITRQGNRFVFDQSKILPYMLKNKDRVALALTYACQDLQNNPDNYSNNPITKLQQLNDKLYSYLEDWNIYRTSNET